MIPSCISQESSDLDGPGTALSYCRIAVAVTGSRAVSRRCFAPLEKNQAIITIVSKLRWDASDGTWKEWRGGQALTSLPSPKREGARKKGVDGRLTEHLVKLGTVL